MAKSLFMTLIIVTVCILTGLGVAYNGGGKPGEVDITISARRYAFEPSKIRVNKGDKVSINLVTKDVTHGFYLEGYDIEAKVVPGDSSEYSKLLLRHPSEHGDYQEVNRIEFTADKPGKFRYRCSVTCGYMHPFMLGEMVVVPNYPFWGGVGLTVGIAISALIYYRRKAQQDSQEDIPAEKQEYD